MLRLHEIKEDNENRKFFFVSFLREDFVGRSLVITVDPAGLVSRVFISSCEEGSVEWLNGSGLDECRMWESDDQAESPSYLTRRYTSRLANGPAGEGHARNILIPDVLDRLEDRALAEFVWKLLGKKRSRARFNFDSVGAADRRDSEL